MKRRKNRDISLEDFDLNTFKDNEVAANRSLSVAALALSIFLFVLWILIMVLSNTRVLHTSNHFVHYSFPIAYVLLAIPFFFRKTKFVEHTSYKYALISIFLFTIALLNIAEPIHSVLGFAIVIAGSCHYYSKKMLNVAFFGSVILLFICLYAGTFIGDWDANLIGVSEINAASYLGIPKEEFVDNVHTRYEVIQKIFEEEKTNRYVNIFFNYFLTRAGALTIIYFISLQLSGRTYRLLTSVSRDAKSRERISGELELAKGIQLNFIPTDFPNNDEYQVYGLISSAKEVGGDFYDYFSSKKDELIFVIGDVSGKGIPGSLTMMRTKTLIKSFAISNDNLNEVLTQANKELCIKNDRNVFVTSVIGKLNLDTGDVVFSNAAHNPPLIKRDGKFEYLKLPKGFVLGGFEETVYKNTSLKLKAGDEIIFYTDGITEAMNMQDEMYGEDRLLELFNNNADKGLEELFEILRQDILNFRKDAKQSDDITILGVLYKGENTQKKEIVVDTLPENIDVLTEFVSNFITTYSHNRKAISQIMVAIDELFSNIVKFAYHPEIGKAILRIELRKEPVSIRITFVDHGKPFNPLEILEPNLDIPVEEREIGGLGIFIVKKTMDEVTYEYKDGQNILTIKKRL